MDKKLQELYDKIKENPLVDEYIRVHGSEEFLRYFIYYDTAVKEGEEDLATKLKITPEELEEGLSVMSEFLKDSLQKGIREPLSISEH